MRGPPCTRTGALHSTTCSSPRGSLLHPARTGMVLRDGILYPQGPGTEHVKETSRKSSGQCSTEKAVEPALNTPTG